MGSFENKLAELLNSYGEDGGSDTPDYILARYLRACLAAFHEATNARTEWFGSESRQAPVRIPQRQ